MQYNFLFFLFVISYSCSSRPILYNNEKIKAYGIDIAEKQIDHCIDLTDNIINREISHGPSGEYRIRHQVISQGDLRNGLYYSTGDSAIPSYGTFNDPEIMKQKYVNACLESRGYRVIGWD